MTISSSASLPTTSSSASFVSLLLGVSVVVALLAIFLVVIQQLSLGIVMRVSQLCELVEGLIKLSLQIEFSKVAPSVYRPPAIIPLIHYLSL